MALYVVLALMLSSIAYLSYRILSPRPPRLELELPHPQQPPLPKRLLIEPSPPQVETWAREIPHDGLVQYYGILGQKRILVTDSKVIHDMFQSHAYEYVKPAAVSKLLKSVLGQGLVVAEGSQHRAQRKALQPAFKLRSVKDLYPLFWSKTSQLVDALRNTTIYDERIDIADYNNRVTLDIIATGGFGLDVNSLANPESPFYQQYMKGFMPSRHAQVFRLLALIFPEWVLDILPLKRNQELRNSTRAVRKLIRQKVSQKASKKASADDEGRKDIISVLRKEGDEIDEEMLVHQCLTFLGAGHDTIAQSLNWGIYELCVNPKIQQGLRKEVQDFMPTNGLNPNQAALEHIATMPYLNAICTEILRLHPPIHHLHRQSLQPVMLNGHELLKGTKFIISIPSMNRSPNLWSQDPCKFNPDRWLDDPNGGARDRQAFLSFSQGPRSCIGERFGRAEMAFILAGLVASFDMEFVDAGEDGQSKEVSVEYGTTTRLEGGLFVRLKKT